MIALILCFFSKLRAKSRKAENVRWEGMAETISFLLSKIISLKKWLKPKNTAY